MAALYEIVASFTPLTRSGAQWVGPCPFEQHEGQLEVIGERWRCACGRHDAGDDALAFLRAIGEPDPEGALANGRIWTPTLLKPTPPVRKYSLASLRPDAKVLIVDNLTAAKAAEALLPLYTCYAWPNGGPRWDLEPLRGREVLLWPDNDGIEAMQRLEAVIADPAGLACTGKMVDLAGPEDVAPWDTDGKTLISWAKMRARPLKYPAQQVASPPSSSEAEAATPGAPPDERAATPPATLDPNNAAPQDAKALAAEVNLPVGAAPSASDGGSITAMSGVHGIPPATDPSSDAPESPVASAEPPPLLDTDFPAETSKTRPKGRRPRPRGHLQIVGNNALEAIESADPGADPLPHELSESGIAAHFVAMHKDRFRTVHEWSGKSGPCWMAWDGARWVREPNRITAMQEGMKLAHGIKYWDAARGVAELSKVKFESRKFIGAFLDLAGYAPEFVATPEQFDADPFLLGTPAGTVDLRIGKVLEPEREHYLTRQTSVAPVAGPHPLFDDVIRRASGGEQDMAEYLWRWLGYLLTGSVKEKAFLYLYGKTDSGKTTLSKAISEIMGDAGSGGYSAQCDIEMFTETKVEKGTDRLAHLAGARFAYASEMEEGRNFKTALLKLATGMDSLKGRFLYAEQFTFTPTHKLWIFGNHKMHMKASDGALINRLHMLEYLDEFIVTPEERDNDFQAKLREEYPAILASMIKATQMYLDCNGLGRPERIALAVEDYATNEDTLGQWILECLDLAQNARCSIGDAYQSFSRWTEKEGGYAPSAKRFSQQLVERGFKRVRSAGVRMFEGFTLKVGANLP